MNPILKLIRKLISGDLPPRSKGQDYIQLNLNQYLRREVRYSWRARNLAEIKSQLAERGFQLRFIPKSSWVKHWYVRGGSMAMLEDTLEVYSAQIKLADITPTKLISLQGSWEELGLDRYYRFPLSRGVLSMVLILSWLLMLVLFHG